MSCAMRGCPPRMRAQVVACPVVVELVAVVLEQRLAEAVDAAQRRAQVVGDRIAERLELLVGGLQLGRALDDPLLELGVEPPDLRPARRQVFRHLVERHRELSDLVVRDDRDSVLQIALGNPDGAVAQGGELLAEVLGDQEPHPRADGDEDHRRHQHGARQEALRPARGRAQGVGEVVLEHGQALVEGFDVREDRVDSLREILSVEMPRRSSSPRSIIAAISSSALVQMTTARPT